MKKRYPALFLTAALTAALLCACGQQTAPPSTGDVSQGEPSERKEIAVIESCSQEGTGKNSEGNSFSYAYHVPQIDDDTPGATSINEEISQIYGVLADVNLEEISNGETPACDSIAYESYRSGDVLCLVIKCTHYYDGSEEFNAYHYNTASGQQLTNDDLLEQLGVTEEQYLDAVRRTAAKCYDDLYFSAWKNLGLDDLSGDYQFQRSRTIAARNITADLPLYLDNDGTAHTITPIGSHAGSDWQYHDLIPDLTAGPADTKIDNTFPGLTVTNQGRNIILTFHKTADGAVATNSDVEIPYEEAIPVNGLYGDYTKILCTPGSDTNTPYVLLLTKEGRVEYINVSACLAGGYFCGGGPLLGAADVTDFATAEDEAGIQWIYGVTADGKQINLLDLIIDDQLCIPTAFTGSWSDSKDDGTQFVSLELAPGNGDNLNLTRLEAHGILPYLGMTGQGMIYAYHVWNNTSNGPGLTGVVALETEYFDDDIMLTVTELHGTPLLGKSTGEVTTLLKSYG